MFSLGKTLAGLALFLVSLVLLLGCLELVVRAAADRSNSSDEFRPDESVRFSPFASDSQLGYRLRADWSGLHKHPAYRVIVRTDGEGRRTGSQPSKETSMEDPFRILILGDSFTFGSGVEGEAAFPSVLEEVFRGRGSDVEVLNGGVPGYSFDHYLILLRNRMPEPVPDLVVIAACENDIEDLAWSALDLDASGMPLATRSRLRFVDRHGRLRYVNESGVTLPGWIERPPMWLQERSHFFNWLRFRVARVWVDWQSARSQTARAQAAGPPPSGPISELEADEIERGLLSGPDFRRRYHGFLFDAIAEELEGRGIPLRVVAIGPGRKGGVAEECVAQERGCLDLADLLPPEHFFSNDGHWKAQGHEIVGLALADWLAKDVPAPDPR
ncbi:MAG: hypothetical protein VX252_09100 [Myxococcota bacterium]|nr:hypothetical protein [Myxococcota bacterium]